MTTPNTDPTRRFSARVEYYVRYRPQYPPSVLEFFKAKLGLLPSHTIADIGSGTGFLTELWLQHGNAVWGVEPNREMREAAEKLLGGYASFQSVDGTAEATTLEATSVDFVTAGQAFHWFNPERARIEFTRILKPGSITALIWNERIANNTPFAQAYEALLQRYGTDYGAVAHRTVTATNVDVLHQFFAPHGFTIQAFPNEQVFDFESLKGRLLSSSYAPLPGHPNYDSTLSELRHIFDEFQDNGTVRFDYQTRVYYG